MFEWRLLPSSEFNGKIPYPSLDEQNQIVSYFRQSNEEIDGFLWNKK
jgi:hypothetical protein